MISNVVYAVLDFPLIKVNYAIYNAMTALNWNYTVQNLKRAQLQLLPINVNTVGSRELSRVIYHASSEKTCIFSFELVKHACHT